MWLNQVFFVFLSVLCLVSTDCPGVVKRKDWDAVNPAHVRYVVRPVSIVVIEHTVTAACSSDAACVSTVQSIQNYHMENQGFWDIGFSFLVGGNGKIYEGCGWLREGAHTLGYNDKSIGIAFIGNYNNNIPTNAQLEAVKNLIECGVQEGHIAQDYHIVGHRQLIATESPGRKLYNVIRTWPNWLEDVSSIKN